MYRVFSGSDGESHIEEMELEDHPELGAMTNIAEVRVQEFDGTRNMDFHPLPERRRCSVRDIFHELSDVDTFRMQSYILGLSEFSNLGKPP